METMGTDLLVEEMERLEDFKKFGETKYQPLGQGDKLDITMYGLTHIMEGVRSDYHHFNKYNDYFLKVSLPKLWFTAENVGKGIHEHPSTEFYRSVFKRIDEKTTPYKGEGWQVFDEKHLEAIKEVLEEERSGETNDITQKIDDFFENNYRDILDIKTQYFKRKEDVQRSYA